MLNTIHTKISTTLAALTGTGKPLSVVYSDPLEDNAQITAFPAVVIGLGQFTNQYMSSAENKIGVTYKLYLCQEVQQAGMAKAHRILREVADKILEKFGDDWNQGETTEGHRIWWTMDVGGSAYDLNEKILYYELNLTANLSYDVS